MAASFQARLSVWIIKWRVKRRLKGVRDYRIARRILHPDPYKVPSAVHISPAQLGGVPGERLEGPSPDNTVLLYLHGGGYFACSAETHRSVTVYFALQGFRVFAPDYRLAPENQFPAAVDDAVAVYRSLLSAGHTSERHRRCGGVRWRWSYTRAHARSSDRRHSASGSRSRLFSLDRSCRYR